MSEEHEWAGTGRALAALVASAIFGVYLAGDRTQPVAAAVLYVAIVVASVVAHEIAHAVVARVCGAEVTGMRLGFGPRLSPAGSPFDLRPLIIAAHVTYVPPRGVSRAKLVAITGAGLAVHLAVVIVALSLGDGGWPAWRIELLAANGFAFVGNAIPMTGGFTSTSDGPNDGAQLADLFAPGSRSATLRDPEVQALLAAYDERGATAAAEALDSLDRADAPYLRLMLARRALAHRHWADAVALVRGADDRSRPWEAAYVYACADATAMLLDGSGTAERVALADDAATAAAGQMAGGISYPERAQVFYALSLVRLLQGRWDEAAGLSMWAVTGATTDEQRAEVIAVQSWALLGLGRRREAEQALAAAMQLHNGPLVRAASRTLAATPATP